MKKNENLLAILSQHNSFQGSPWSMKSQREVIAWNVFPFSYVMLENEWFFNFTLSGF